MAKRPTRAEREHADNVAHARATVAGPALLAACRPVADRLREQLRINGGNDLVGVFLTMPEVNALLTAVEKADGKEAPG